MAHPNLSIPSISISLAEDPVHSPLDSQPPSPPSQEDDYRSSYLSPPPVVSPRFFHRQPSPLRANAPGEGLDPSRFEALLASTRERNACAKKGPDLRKELAMKAHKSKQSTPFSVLISSLALSFLKWNVALCFCPRSTLLPPLRPRPSRKLLLNLRLSFIIPYPPQALIPHSRYSSLYNRPTQLDRSNTLLSSHGLRRYTIVNLKVSTFVPLPWNRLRHTSALMGTRQPPRTSITAPPFLCPRFCVPIPA